MSSMRARIILICVVVLVVGGAIVYGMFFLPGDEEGEGRLVAERPDASGLPAAAGDSEDKPFAQYRAITDRAIFRPLVAEPSATEEVTIPPDVPSPTSSGGPPPRPDPFAGLAMTGVVERGRAKALIIDTRTGQGRYAAEGEEAFGARVLDIQAKRVRVEKDGETKDLILGENVPKETPTAAASSSGSSGPSQSRGSGERRSVGGMGSGEMRERFGSMSDAERQEFIRRMRARRLGYGC
ncbi:MAG: hypothetical protein ACE5R4_04460 [Armatimonadota bacterium]